MNLIKHKRLVLLTILLLAVVSRFWKLESLFHWTLDEEFWSYLPHNVATFYHLPLIGGHIGGTGVYSGPLFVWLMGIVFFLIRSQPLMLAGSLSLLGVLTTYLVYRYVKLNYNTLTALFASLLYGTSTTAVLYDRKYWNASLASILAVISLILVQGIRRKPSFRLVAALVFTASLAIHAHMTGLVVVVFSTLSLILYKVPKKFVIFLIVGIVVSHLPLLVFDLRHDFINTKALMEVFESDTTSAKPDIVGAVNVTLSTFSRLLFIPALDISDELTLCTAMADTRSQPQLVYSIVVGVVLLYSLHQLLKRSAVAVLLWINIALVIAYQFLSPENFYVGQLSEYYLLPAFAAFLILVADLLAKLYRKSKFAALTLVLFLVIINFKVTLNIRHTHGFSTKKQRVEDVINLVGNRSFTLDVTGDKCQIYGYRYLFTLYSFEPVESYLDDSFSWLYQRRLPVAEPELDVLIDIDSARIDIHESTFQDQGSY